MPPSKKQQDEDGAKDAAEREESRRVEEREQSSAQATARQSTETAEKAGARKLRFENGQPVYDDIANKENPMDSGNEVAAKQRAEQIEQRGDAPAQQDFQRARETAPGRTQTEYDRVDMKSSQGIATISPDTGDLAKRASQIQPVTGDVNAEGALSAKDVREVIGPDGQKILVSPNRAVAGAIDTPNIIQEADGRLVSPFQPNKHQEVEITGGGGHGGRGTAPRARLVRAAPSALSDEQIDTLSSAELRAIAHDRGYNINATGAHTVRSQFRQRQQDDKSLKQQQDPMEKAREAFERKQEDLKQAVSKLEDEADKLKQKAQEMRDEAGGGKSAPVQEIKPNEAAD